jgi:hypothetical protein
MTTKTLNIQYRTYLGPARAILRSDAIATATLWTDEPWTVYRVEYVGHATACMARDDGTWWEENRESYSFVRTDKKEIKNRTLNSIVTMRATLVSGFNAAIWQREEVRGWIQSIAMRDRHAELVRTVRAATEVLRVARNSLELWKRENAATLGKLYADGFDPNDDAELVEI